MPKRYHHDSEYGDGPRRPLDRNGRARFSYLLDAHHRAGRLTRAARDIGRALLRRLGGTGQCDPSHNRLAEDATCCERTVERACGVLRGLGLLHWTRRLRRIGPYVEQTTNAYRLCSQAACAPARIGDRQDVGGSRTKILPELVNPDLEALAMIRTARMKALAARWRTTATTG